ncbi:MAG: hypothetical protein RI965_1854 [Bacteroidota bacterium]|jgi:deoxyribodipyrimidine photo-lyase
MSGENYITNYNKIIQLLDRIDPIKYGRTRNFIHGAVTQLSPYISRGVLDTEMIFQHLARKKYTYYQCEKFIQQLLWREYFQRVWQIKKSMIDRDLKNKQEEVSNWGIPISINNAQTSIHAIDEGIRKLKTEGSMHNHLRMYIAFLSCNLGNSHWYHPAQWMYYYLLDGDWGSNALSWQWVAGTFSNKKYIANQENINHYTGTNQTNTFLDISYEVLQNLSTPAELKNHEIIDFETNLPENTSIQIDQSLPTLLYNYYNLSPTWKSDIKANRILLLEPAIFKKYPVSDRCISFMMELSSNIKDVQIFTGSFEELKSKTADSTIHYREHPLNEHYQGIEDPRPWILPDADQVTGSFFSFWKKNAKKLRLVFSKNN